MGNINKKCKHCPPPNQCVSPPLHPSRYPYSQYPHSQYPHSQYSHSQYPRYVNYNDVNYRPPPYNPEYFLDSEEKKNDSYLPEYY